jgi:O-antigen/teichoic acid export membrane protein
MTLIAKIWKGEETLAKTFWIYFILVNLCFQIVGVPIFLKFGWAGIWTGSILEFIWFIWIAVAIWRSSEKVNNKIWKYMSRAVLFLFIAEGLYTLFQIFYENNTYT